MQPVYYGKPLKNQEINKDLNFKQVLYLGFVLLNG